MEQFQVIIPETAINGRIDKLVAYKLRHEKIEQMLTEAMDVSKTNAMAGLIHSVTEEFAKMKDQIIASHIESKKTVVNLKGNLKFQLKGTEHAEMPKLMSFLTLFKQAMIVGPTGSGKSTIAKQVADVMKLRYASFSCNAEASKSELVGFANINGYITSQFLDFYENGGVFLVDEYDAMSPSIAVVLNAVFDRTGQISVPNRVENPIAKKHKNFYCILAGNTWGSGSVEYQGREMQDMAFLDRFKLCRIHIGYDEQIERSIAGQHYEWMMLIRKFMNDYVENEKFSTRSIYDAATLLHNNFEGKDVLKMISAHWDASLQEKLMDKCA